MGSGALFIPDPITLAVAEMTQVGEARRAAARMAEALGFGETARGQIAIVVTEIATNLVRHTSAGEVILRSLPPVDCCGLEVLGLDRGPGIANLADAMRDGFSTANTAGNGLGAVDRLSTTFDLYSTADRGTAIVAQFRVGDAPPGESPGSVGWVCLPLRGETACGDACAVLDVGGGRTVVVIADGLGHGVNAAQASRRAVALFHENVALDGPALLDVLHAGLRSTRGAAISVADIRRGSRELRFTGVGNVSGRLVTPTATRGLLAQNGTVGAEMRRVREVVYPWADDSLLIMHSDGLTSQWHLADYRGLATRHASLVAGVLYRDFRRERDDVTVLALTDRGHA